MKKLVLAAFATSLLTATSMVSVSAKPVVPEGGWQKEVEADWSRTESGMITGKDSKPLSYKELTSNGKDLTLNLYQTGASSDARVMIKDGSNNIVFDGGKLTSKGIGYIKGMTPAELAKLNSIAAKQGLYFDSAGKVEWIDTNNKGDAQAKANAAESAMEKWAKENGATRSKEKKGMDAKEITAEHDKILDGHDDRLTELNERFATEMEKGKSYVDLSNAHTLQQAKDYTDARYNSLNKKIKKLRGRADAGIAGATAIGSLAFDTLKPNSVAGGLGVAKNKVAGAVGYQRNINDHWRARGTLAVSDKYVQGGASVGYSW